MHEALVHDAPIEKAQPRLPVRDNVVTHDKGRSTNLLGIGALRGHPPLKHKTLRKQTCERMGKEVVMRA
jgi:hypothetical protein